MLVAEDKVVWVNRVGDLEPREADFEAARSSLTTGAAARSGVFPAVAARFDFWPVTSAGGQRAAVGLAFDPDERTSTPDTLVEIVGSILALALDRQH